MLGGQNPETVTPYAQGDILVTKPFGRVIVETADVDAAGRQVCVCVRLDNGATCVVLEREVTYRSR
jgi:hypothetical protein